MEGKKLDFIHSMMFSLRVPEITQKQVLAYYEATKKAPYLIGTSRIKVLAPSLV